MIKKLLFLLVLLLTATTGAWAQEQWDVVWDFTAWSTETVTALKADAAASKLEGWSDVEKKTDAEAGADPDAAAKDNCFWFAGTVNEDGSLSANGAVIKELKGLKFNSDYAAKRSLAIAVNYPSTSLGEYAGGAYLLLGGGGSKQPFPCFTIPGVKAGSKITVELESHKPSDGRGIGLYKNSYAAENLIGEQFKPKTLEAKTWEIAEDCDVVVWNTSNCHIYTIKVKAPAAPAGYTVSLKDGVKDADKWSVKVGEGEAQAFPVEGLEGGEKITVTYSGEKKVKSVKAVKKAAVTYPLLSAATAEDVGKVVCAAGHLHDAKTAVPDGCTAVGILGKVTETGHGLILAMQNATEQTWTTINGWTSVTTYAGTTLKVLPDAARGTNLTSYTTLGATAVSNWAVAQKSDYEAIFTNLGSTKNSDGMTYDNNVNAYITTGVGGTAISGNYWSATELDGDDAWDFSSRWDYYDKSSSSSIRPVLGF